MFLLQAAARTLAARFVTGCKIPTLSTSCSWKWCAACAVPDLMPAVTISIGIRPAEAYAMPPRACVMPGPPIMFTHAISVPPEAWKTPAAANAADSSLEMRTAHVPGHDSRLE